MNTLGHSHLQLIWCQDLILCILLPPKAFCVRCRRYHPPHLPDVINCELASSDFDSHLYFPLIYNGNII